VTAAGRRRIGACLAAVALAAVLPHTAWAKPGDLDGRFGEAGRAATSADLGAFWRRATVRVAPGPDGSIVVASKRQLFRYGGDGHLDDAFGESGKVTLQDVEGLSVELTDVEVDDAGRIVAFGTAVDRSVLLHVPFYWLGAWVHPTFAIVLRLDPTGRLDPTFGGRDGVVRTDLGLPRNIVAEGDIRPPLVRLISGEVDSQGRLLAIATSAEFIHFLHASALVWPGRVVVRLTESGDPDPAFGGSGLVVLGGPASRGLAFEPDSEPLLAWGESGVTALRADGTLDAGYGSGGMSSIGGEAAALDRFGRLLVLQRPKGTAGRVVRLTSDGDIDGSFGRNGRITLKRPMKAAALGSIAVDPRGRVLLAGTAMRTRSVRNGLRNPAEFFLLGRLSASGRLDRSFGREGWTRTGFGRRTKVAAAHEVIGGPRSENDGPQIALDAGERLVVVATARSPQLQPGGVVLARYLLDR